MIRKLETDLKKTVMPLTYGFSWLQEVIMYSKITKFSDKKTHLKMMQSFFLHNSFSIIQAIRPKEEKTWNRPQKDCNAINLWLFMATRSDYIQ